MSGVGVNGGASQGPRSDSAKATVLLVPSFYLSADVLRYIAAALKLPLSQVYGVVTFYHFFTMVPRGKHQILVCTGTTCHVRGSKAIRSGFPCNPAR